jgi:hypothetical protein
VSIKLGCTFYIAQIQFFYSKFVKVLTINALVSIIDLNKIYFSESHKILISSVTIELANDLILLSLTVALKVVFSLILDIKLTFSADLYTSL